MIDIVMRQYTRLIINHGHFIHFSVIWLLFIKMFYVILIAVGVTLEILTLIIRVVFVGGGRGGIFPVTAS